MPESDNQAFCPWCLHQDRPINFIAKHENPTGELLMEDTGYRAEKKKTRGLVKCPECRIQFRWDSLVRNHTEMEEYVRFLLSYPWHERKARLNWDKVKVRLKDMGLANEFWELWFKLKPEYSTEKKMIE